MTVPADPRSSDQGAPAALADPWRAQRMSTQQQAMPAGRVVVSCPAPYGAGGLGRHLQEIAEALARRGDPAEIISESSGLRDGGAPRPALGLVELAGAVRRLARLSPAWRMWAVSAGFDAAAARRLRPADHLIAFNGTALAQFGGARKAGAEGLWLMSANPHMRRVIGQHERAYRRHPVERPWSTHLLRRNLAEYERADGIYVSSRYVWESFAQEGFAEDRLRFFPLTPDPRFQPSREPRRSNTFDVLYSGSLVVHKGVPLLIDAFRRLAHEDLRLVLLGGWKTAQMRRYIERACAEDQRISAGPGDPLGNLHDASLCVHPAYEDGFAYAPAEALACGVPVIVSEDTGMKELIGSDRHGLVLPTGDADTLAQAIDAAYRGEILGG
jgi:glycosyltransferase involved in cell wall biosynthesis